MSTRGGDRRGGQDADGGQDRRGARPDEPSRRPRSRARHGQRAEQQERTGEPSLGPTKRPAATRQREKAARAAKTQARIRGPACARCTTGATPSAPTRASWVSPRAGEHEGQDEEWHAQQDASRPDEGAPQERATAAKARISVSTEPARATVTLIRARTRPPTSKKSASPVGSKSGSPGNGAAAKPAHRVEPVGAVVLQRAPRQVRDVVERGVIGGHSTDEGEVQARHAALPLQTV